MTQTLCAEAPKNLNLYIDCTDLVTKSINAAISRVDMLADQDLVNVLCRRAANMLVHSCLYCFVGTSENNTSSVAKAFAEGICTDVMEELMDTQVADLDEGYMLDYIKGCGRTFDDNTFIIDYIDAAHIVAIEGFVMDVTKDIREQVITPIFRDQPHECLVVTEHPGGEFAYIIRMST